MRVNSGIGQRTQWVRFNRGAGAVGAGITVVTMRTAVALSEEIVRAYHNMGDGDANNQRLIASGQGGQRAFEFRANNTAAHTEGLAFVAEASQTLDFEVSSANANPGQIQAHIEVNFRRGV